LALPPSIHQLGRPLGEALFQQVVDIHPRVRIVALQRHGRAVHPFEQPLLLQGGEIVAHRHLRYPGALGELAHAHLAGLVDQGEDLLVA